MYFFSWWYVEEKTRVFELEYSDFGMAMRAASEMTLSASNVSVHVSRDGVSFYYREGK